MVTKPDIRMSLQRVATIIGHHCNSLVFSVRSAIHLQRLVMRLMWNTKTHIKMTVPQEFLWPKSIFQTQPGTIFLCPELTGWFAAIPRSASRKGK